MFESKDNLHDRIVGLSDIELSKTVFEEHSNYREEERPKEINIGWLKLYVYIIIPYGFINSFYQALNEVSLLNFLIVGISLIIGMHKWKLWGWNLNLALLIMSAFVKPILRVKDTSNYLSISITLLLVWCIPNFIYFLK